MDLRDLAPIAILFVVVGLTLSVGAQVLQRVQTQVTGSESVASYPKTFPTNNSFMTLSAAKGPLTAVTVYYNSSKAILLNGTTAYSTVGYTTNLSDIRDPDHTGYVWHEYGVKIMMNVTQCTGKCDGFQWGNWNWPNASTNNTYVVDYTYDVRSLAVMSTSNATTGMSQVSQWLPTIGLVVAAAIVIGVVLGSFRLGKRE